MFNLRRAKSLHVRKKDGSTNKLETFGEVSATESRLAQLQNTLLENPMLRLWPKRKLKRNQSVSVDFIHELLKSELFSSQRRRNVESDSESEKYRQFLKDQLKQPNKQITTNKEILKNCETKTEKKDTSNTPKSFPIDHEDAVSLRPASTRTTLRAKTVDFGRPSKNDKNESKPFKIPGLTKLQYADVCIKIKKKQEVRYENGKLCLYNDNQFMELISKQEVDLKSIKSLRKHDVELKDTRKNPYLLTFGNSKDANHFLQQDVIQRSLEKSTIKNHVRRLLQKRPSRDDLEKKGIYKNEAIFNNCLKNVYQIKKSVPEFVTLCMEHIERPENITSMGIYRTSGNLATIQKIRTEVDKGQLGILKAYMKDVDVLTGTLKLFFRELKESLITQVVSENILEFIDGCDNVSAPSRKDKEKLKRVLMGLDVAHLETLICLIRHLLKVAEHKEQNKMDYYNLSVCWGPTIIFFADCKDPVSQSGQATRVVEFLLSYFGNFLEELEQLHRKDNKSYIRQDSMDSIDSAVSLSSKHSASGVSGSTNGVYENIKRLVDLIESSMSSENIEGMYKRSGSHEKTKILMKKIQKSKLSDLKAAELKKYNIHDLCAVLKKYIKEMPKPLIPNEVFQDYCNATDISHNFGTIKKNEIFHLVQNIPMKDPLFYLLKHINGLFLREKEHRISRSDLIKTWAMVLNDKLDMNYAERYNKFIECLLDMSGKQIPHQMPDLIQEIQSKHTSHYDNVHMHVPIRGEAVFLDEEHKTELTKL